MGIVRKFRFAKEHNANHPDPGGPSCRGQHIDICRLVHKVLKTGLSFITDKASGTQHPVVKTILSNWFDHLE